MTNGQLYKPSARMENEMMKLNISVGLRVATAISLMTLTLSMVFIMSANKIQMTKSTSQKLEKSLDVEYETVQSEGLYDKTNQFVIFKINNIRNVSA